MNLLHEFSKALSMNDYMEKLGDQKKLHDLHFKKARISDGFSTQRPIKVLVITEPWCGDSVAILPVLNKFFSDNPVEMRVALRDENDALMSRFLTNGGKAIPIILVLNARGDLLMRFGPRPKKAQAIYEAHRSDIESGKIEKKEVSRKIRSFYAKDRGQTILEEFRSELKKVI